MTNQQAIQPLRTQPIRQTSLVSMSATMNITQAATYLGIAKSTLYTWRTRRPGFGPRAVKAGGALRYRRSDLDVWIEAHAEALDDPEADHIHADTRSAASQSGALGSMSRRSRPRQR